MRYFIKRSSGGLFKHTYLSEYYLVVILGKAYRVHCSGYIQEHRIGADTIVKNKSIYKEVSQEELNKTILVHNLTGDEKRKFKPVE